MDSKFSYRKILSKYTIALGLVALMSCSAFFMTYQLVRSQESSASIINAAGKRRFISQQAALFVLQLCTASNDDDRAKSRKRLADVLELFVKIHDGLLRGDVSMNLPSTMSPEVQRYYLEEPVNLAAKAEQFLAMTKTIMDMPVKDLHPGQPIIVEFMEFTTGPFLQSLDGAVSLYQRENEGEISRLQSIETTVLIFTLFLLATEAMFIFLPLARSLRKSFETIEERVMERTEQLQHAQRTVISQQQALISSAKMSALGEMAGGVAHEINTPLAIIKMHVEQLEECVNEGDLEALDFKNAIEVIKNTMSRITKIVSGLRSFSREGKADPAQSISIASLIEDTLSFCSERFRNHGVHLDVVNKESYQTIKIECRSVEVSQALLNLLNNSYDAIERLSEKWIRIETFDLGEFIEIAVTDSGPGIPEAIRSKLMQPFFTTKEIGKGTGLGLSISKGIIESHHGTFRLDTDSPNTRFTISLPKVQNRSTSLKQTG